LGDPNSVVDIGDHRYVIRYQTTRQVGRFKDSDELYWNATGNGWMFPIDLAEARIRLPSAAAFGQRSTYTGPQARQRRTPEWSRKSPAISHSGQPGRLDRTRG
ncbi:MAG TPA: DUF2207 domain-containing protein, partial [Sphingomicrobium sp.]